MSQTTGLALPELRAEMFGLKWSADSDESLQGDEDREVHRAALADHSNLRYKQSSGETWENFFSIKGNSRTCRPWSGLNTKN